MSRSLERKFHIYFSRELGNVGRKYMDFLQKNFNKEFGYDNNTKVNWADKKASTKKQYQRHGWNTTKIGVRTGDMKRSMILKQGNTGNGWYLEYSNTKDYAQYFNKLRPFLYAYEPELEDIIEKSIDVVSKKLLKDMKRLIENK